MRRRLQLRAAGRLALGVIAFTAGAAAAITPNYWLTRAGGLGCIALGLYFLMRAAMIETEADAYRDS
jgi:hypothetical protein